MIVYEESKEISDPALHLLFTSNEMNDWFPESDTQHYIESSLFVASAWDGLKCVGVAVLCGDGTISVELDVLLVDSSYRNRGIATKLMHSVMKRANELEPYHFKIEVFEGAAEKFYSQFGFRKNEGTWLLEHGPTGERTHQTATRIRKELGKVTSS